MRSYSQRIRIAAYMYVKAQTGAQFSIKEMDRYLSLFPTSITPPEQAEADIKALLQQAVSYIEAAKVRWNAVQTPSGLQWIQPGYIDRDPEQNPPLPSEPVAAGGAETPEQRKARAKAIVDRVLSGKP